MTRIKQPLAIRLVPSVFRQCRMQSAVAFLAPLLRLIAGAMRYALCIEKNDRWPLFAASAGGPKPFCLQNRVFGYAFYAGTCIIQLPPSDRRHPSSGSGGSGLLELLTTKLPMSEQAPPYCNTCTRQRFLWPRANRKEIFWTWDVLPSV